MEPIALYELGLPAAFIGRLTHPNGGDLLSQISLSEFLALWKLEECLQRRPDGTSFVRYGNFVQLQAVLIDIGGTIASTSLAEPEELLQLTWGANAEGRVEMWQHIATRAGQYIQMYEEVRQNYPDSLHNLMTIIGYTHLSSLYEEVNDSNTPGDLSEKELLMARRQSDWFAAAANAINLGFAIERLHADFYYHLGEFTDETQNYDTQTHEGIIPTTKLKRDQHLIHCRIWANLCRPDLAYLLGNE